MAEGANDDGSGVAAVLEATRVLNSLGLKPLRTIRFVFFSGEEEGLLGFRAYVLAHKRELDHLSAALIVDEGAQAPHGFRFQGRIDPKNSMEKLLLIWRGKPLVVQNHTSVCRLRILNSVGPNHVQERRENLKCNLGKAATEIDVPIRLS